MELKQEDKMLGLKQEDMYERTVARLRKAHGSVTERAAITILAEEIEEYRGKIQAMEQHIRSLEQDRRDYDRLYEHCKDLERRDEKRVETIVKLAEKLAGV